MIKHKVITVIVVNVILLMATVWLLVAIPGSPTYGSLRPQATITPTVWAYLPCISRQQYETIYSSHNLSGHSISAECNPGGTTDCSCSDADVYLTAYDDYGEVTSNPRRINTYVNAIGGKKFVETFPNGKPIALGVYSYRGQFRLPVLPAANASQEENAQAIHMMIQLWDGRNALYQSNKTTLEGTIYWNLNAWTPDYGNIKVYIKPLNLIDTGITLLPDTDNWHTFELVVDLASQKYVSITIDGESRDLSHLELAQVSQPSWGNEVALLITTESLAAWPGETCPHVFTWRTQFSDLEFRQLNDSGQ